MKTLHIEILNKKVHKLIKSLEALNLIRILDKKKAEPQEDLYKKYVGRLSPEVAEELHEYVKKSRDEWNARNV